MEASNFNFHLQVYSKTKKSTKNILFLKKFALMNLSFVSNRKTIENFYIIIIINIVICAKVNNSMKKVCGS